jgi:hypothetical protein
MANIERIKPQGRSAEGGNHKKFQSRRGSRKCNWAMKLTPDSVLNVKAWAEVKLWNRRDISRLLQGTRLRQIKITITHRNAMAWHLNNHPRSNKLINLKKSSINGRTLAIKQN